MNITELNGHFLTFTKLAGRDGFIDLKKENAYYRDVVSKIPEEHRAEAEKDGMIDFFEYLEATSQFSRKDIMSHKDKILRYSIDRTIEECVPQYGSEDDMRLYNMADEGQKEKIIFRAQKIAAEGYASSVHYDLGNGKYIDISLDTYNESLYSSAGAVRFLTEVYKISTNKRKIAIREKSLAALESLPKSRIYDPYFNAADNLQKIIMLHFETIFPDCSKNEKMRIIKYSEPYIGFRTNVAYRASVLFVAIYQNVDESTKKEIIEKYAPLLKENAPFVSEGAVNFFKGAFVNSSPELKHKIARVMIPLVEEKWWVRGSAFKLVSSAYFDLPDMGRKEIADALIGGVQKSGLIYQVRDFIKVIWPISSDKLKEDIRERVRALLGSDDKYVQKGAREIMAIIGE